MDSKEQLYPFYKANIHENRLAARLARAFPLIFLTTFAALVLYAAARAHLLLLVLSAVTNVAIWLWLTSTCLFGIAGTFLVKRELEKLHNGTAQNAAAREAQPQVGSDSVVHLILLPNYKEDEKLLEETIGSLAEADDAQFFHIVLAMEARETESDVKAANLRDKFKDRFAKIWIFFHPGDLMQDHNDGTSSPEVPGKASNLKWAAEQAYETIEKEGQLSLASVMLTVADADCIFHPSYFSHISKEFDIMREMHGDDHKWTMWQAPQLSYRNHWGAPLCSRTWTYISSMYEFGGVSGLQFGGHHMAFSSYSLPLQLAHQSDSWDGDVVAEDHHCYVKNVFYSLYTSATSAEAKEDGCRQKLQIRPVFLPVKSTPVISPDSYWSSYVERWHQAKRHAQGVSELCYALLAAYDTLTHLPIHTYSWSLFAGIGKVIMRLCFVHLLPLAQSMALGVLTIYWLRDGNHFPGCPEHLRIEMALESHFVLCGLAGTWTLIWPVVVPMFLLILANYMFIWCAFLAPSDQTQSAKLWYREDGEFEARLGSKHLAAFCLTAGDCVFLLMPMMVSFSLIASLLAIWNTAFYGNNIKYISAAKSTRATGGYGTCSDDKA